MSPFETFYLLFESNSDEVKKAAKDAKQYVDQLEKSLTSTKQKSDKVGDSIQGIVRQLGAAVVGFVSIGSVIAGFKSAKDYAYSLSTLSYALNANIEEISAWAGAVEIYGGSAQTFEATTLHMTAALQTFATTGHGHAAPFFKELGIRMTDAQGKARSFLEILPELADAFGKLSKNESFGIGKKLGLDTYTILLLQDGRQAVEDIIRRQKELGTVTEKDIDVITSFNMQWADTTQIFRALNVAANTLILPVFEKFLKIIADVGMTFRKHKDLMIGGFIAIGIAAAAAALPMLIAFAPVLATTGAILALISFFAILYDDVVNFYKGNNSLIGQLIKKWPIVGDILKTIEAIVKDTGALLIDIGNGVIAFWKLVWDNVGPIISLIVKGIGKIANAYQGVKDFFATKGAEYKVKKELINTSQAYFNRADTSPLNAVSTPALIAAGNKSANQNTAVNIDTINLQTQASDFKGISGAIGDYLKEEMQQANANFDDAVLA